MVEPPLSVDVPFPNCVVWPVPKFVGTLAFPLKAELVVDAVIDACGSTMIKVPPVTLMLIVLIVKILVPAATEVAVAAASFPSTVIVPLVCEKYAGDWMLMFPFTVKLPELTFNWEESAVPVDSVLYRVVPVPTVMAPPEILRIPKLPMVTPVAAVEAVTINVLPLTVKVPLITMVLATLAAAFTVTVFPTETTTASVERGATPVLQVEPASQAPLATE